MTISTEPLSEIVAIVIGVGGIGDSWRTAEPGEMLCAVVWPLEKSFALGDGVDVATVFARCTGRGRLREENASVTGLSYFFPILAENDLPIPGEGTLL